MSLAACARLERKLEQGKSESRLTPPEKKKQPQSVVFNPSPCPKSKVYDLNGRRVYYRPDSEFLVQSGGGMGLYKTVRRIQGNIELALLSYHRIITKPGHKKRLLMPASSYPTLLSERK